MIVIAVAVPYAGNQQDSWCSGIHHAHACMCGGIARVDGMVIWSGVSLMLAWFLVVVAEAGGEYGLNVLGWLMLGCGWVVKQLFTM